MKDKHQNNAVEQNDTTNSSVDTTASQDNENEKIQELPDDIGESKGILIYESAREKLNISRDGKIYRQKWFNYLPYVSVISILIYINYIFGKAKCLKDNDLRLFKKTYTWCNIIGFLIMPLVALALWTFATWMIYEVIPGNTGAYTSLWSELLYDPLSKVDSADIQQKIAVALKGLFSMALAPMVPISPTILVSVSISGTTVNLNLIFLAVLLVFTVINPLNIIYTFIMNARMLRFITVYETSDVYRYRQ